MICHIIFFWVVYNGSIFSLCCQTPPAPTIPTPEKKLDPEATSRFCSKRVMPNIQQTENITSNLTPRKLKKVDAYKIWIRILLVSLWRRRTNSSTKPKLIRKATVFQRGDLMRYTTTCWHPRVVSVNPSSHKPRLRQCWRSGQSPFLIPRAGEHFRSRQNARQCARQPSRARAHKPTRSALPRCNLG